MMGLSRLAKLKSLASSQDEIPWKLQEKSFFDRAMEVMWRPRPKSPASPRVTKGVGVGRGMVDGTEVGPEKREKIKNRKAFIVFSILEIT